MDFEPYFVLARRLYTGEFAEENLAAAASALPPLTETALARLAEEAATLGPVIPRHGWALAAVTDASARRGEDTLLQARAAWHLARAANRWLHPQQATRAANRAHALFEAAAAPGWAAAALWQAHALAWAHPNFRQVVERLEQALAGVEAAGHEWLLPYCRRDLGFAYLLVVEREKGLAAIGASERAFREQQAWREVARTLTVKATALRRLGQYDEALATIAEALSLLDEEREPLDYQLARFRQAALRTLRGVDYGAAEAALQAVAAWYREADIPVMEGQAHTLLQRLYLETGRLPEAVRAVERARRLYAPANIVGMQADNFLDSGRLAFVQGEYRQALRYYERAQARYAQLEIPYMVAVSIMYRGDSYGELGRYQQALATQEEAYARFEEMGDDNRRAECALALADTWLRLNRPEAALALIAGVTDFLQREGRTFFLTRLYATQVEACLRQGEHARALALLQEATGGETEEHLPVGQTYLWRLRGEVLCAQARPAEALPLLRRALSRQQEVGLPFEVATTQVSLGDCCLQLERPDAARAAWEAALGGSQGAEPELAWRAHAGLARLAATGEEALAAYRQAVAALTRLRRSFWQPAVAGAYLHRPLRMLEEALALAARLGEGAQALAFIEAGKAQALLRQLALAQAAPGALAVAERPRELAAEIRWLRRQIEASVRQNPGLFVRPAGERRLRSRLRERLEEYEHEFGQRQRRRVRPLAEQVPPLPGEFDVKGWRAQARAAWGARWAALDYYRAGNTIQGVLITPEATALFTEELDPLEARILAQWTRSRPAAQAVRPDDLAQLGRRLLPPALADQLEPDTLLLIAPHGALHHLPWPALPLADGRLLVEAAIPVLAPSLAAIAKIGQRAPRAAARQDGLLLAVSAFAEARHDPLPAVGREAAVVMEMMGAGSERLLEREATWPRLQALSGGDGLAGGGAAPLAFWHIASHAFHDGLAGRLSGVALYERDLWLDDLWALAPLPPLVVLSACNGSRGLFYPGDEQMGLASTCLAAGARQVVGSLWPVLDTAAAALTRAFYRHYREGAGPARALACAQREALAAGRPLAEWASFICTGAPAPVTEAD